MTTTSRGPSIAAPTEIAGPAAAGVGELWDRLARPALTPSRFDPSMVVGLPEPARRWLRHAIAPGSKLHRAVVIEMDGQIRLGRWLRIRALQLHAPPHGYVWAARARLGPLSISGYDRYADGTGEMRWRLLGRVPVMNAAGADIDRSAAGRVALDALFVPTAWLGPAVTWHEGPSDSTAIAEWKVGSHRLPVQIRVGADGRLVAATTPRWGNPNGEPWGVYPCGGMVDDEVDFDGIMIPTRVRAGWFFGTEHWADGEFFRAAITSAAFL